MLEPATDVICVKTYSTTRILKYMYMYIIYHLFLICREAPCPDPPAPDPRLNRLAYVNQVTWLMETLKQMYQNDMGTCAFIIVPG